MLLRVIVGVALLPILPLVLFFAPGWVFPLVVGALSAAAAYELLGVTGIVKNKRVLCYALIFSAALSPRFYFFDRPGWLSLAGMFLLIFVLFVEALCNPKEITFHTICAVVMTGLIVPTFFSSLIRITQMPQGKHVIMLPFIAALLTDTCAYFAGVLLGKHKLAPDISPKKTVEGAVGGILGCILGMVSYGLIESLGFHNGVNFALIALYGLLGSVVAQVGDLSMSLVKRQYGIKDFGKLMPGHGGILDRFDSLLFAAPLIELLLVLLPAITVAV